MKLWPSKYNVHFLIEAPKDISGDNSIYVLQNLFNGQVDFFSPPIPSLFKQLEHSTEIQVGNEGCSGVLDRLIEKKFLYRSKEEEAVLVQKYVDTAGQRDAIIAHQRGSQYCFLPTYSCNLRCLYCFQRKLVDKGHFMNERMVDLAFNAIDEVEANQPDLKETFGGKMPVPGISIVGGEPLLGSSRQRRVLERIIQCSEDRGFKYSVITNGVNLKNYVDLFDRTLMITDIQVTIDGPAPIHNIRRAFPNGRATFNIIESGINAALDKRLPLSLRINLDLGNIDYVKELGEFILNTGWLMQITSIVTFRRLLTIVAQVNTSKLRMKVYFCKRCLSLYDSDQTSCQGFRYKTFPRIRLRSRPVEERYQRFQCSIVVKQCWVCTYSDPQGEIFMCV